MPGGYVPFPRRRGEAMWTRCGVSPGALTVSNTSSASYSTLLPAWWREGGWVVYIVQRVGDKHMPSDSVKKATCLTPSNSMPLPLSLIFYSRTAAALLHQSVALTKIWDKRASGLVSLSHPWPARYKAKDRNCTRKWPSGIWRSKTMKSRI